MKFLIDIYNAFLKFIFQGTKLTIDITKEYQFSHPTMTANWKDVPGAGQDYYDSNIKHYHNAGYLIREKPVEETEKKVKAAIYNYCEYHNIDWVRWQLHMIEVKPFRNIVNVYVTLGRPGLFIGTHGYQMDAIQAQISKVINKPVKLYITEYNVFGK
jgi:predicted RNA-binding protein Jag